jgi:tetratricopeptide (TPR) repeat protein
MAEPIKFIPKTGTNPEQPSGGELVQFRKKPNIHESNDAEFWFAKGVELESSADTINDAIAAYEKVLELNPNYAAAFVNLGCIYYNRRDFKQAEKLYRKATEIDPNYAPAWFDFGNVLDETLKLDKAAQAYKRAVEISPKFADAHYNLALVFQRQGQNSKALVHWKTYAKLDPTSPWTYHALNQIKKIQKRLGFQIVGKQAAEEKPLELKTVQEELHPS